MVTDELKRNIESVKSRVERAAARVGRGVTLVAATKTVPPDIVNAAIGMGITDVGENRVNEYIGKRDAVKGANWHFIGTLQTNKVKYLVGNVVLIQSVASARMADEISRLAVKRGVVQRVLVEINIGGETSKTGAEKSDADALIEYVRTLDGVELKGVMAIPPRDCEAAVYRELYSVYARHAGGAFDTLSVGMSADYERAIEYGSNMVRVGAAIFGARG